MIELFTSLTLTQVIVFSFLILIAIKEGITLYDFFKKKIKDAQTEETSERVLIEKIHEKLDKLEKEMEEQKKRDLAIDSKLKFLEQDTTERKVHETAILEQQKEFSMKLDQQQETLTLLTDSDRDDIRSWIVHQYHYFVEQRKWIDDFTMDALEKRYAHYCKEGGNSYVSNLMSELRKLPRSPQ